MSTNENKCVVTTQNESNTNATHSEKNLIKIESTFQDSNTLPPIQVKTPVCSHSSANDEPAEAYHHRSSLAKEAVVSNGAATVLESEKATQKLYRRRKTSRDYVEPELIDGKRKNERTRKAKRKFKPKSQDSTCDKQLNWQITNEIENVGNVVTLPQIDTPDLICHQGNTYVDASSPEGKFRRKKQSDAATAREFETLKRIKERPCSSHEQASLKDGGSFTRSIGKIESNERKEAFTGASPSPREQMFIASTESTNCCLNCQTREEKIKRDYDRMILFSKKDRVSKMIVYIAHSCMLVFRVKCIVCKMHNLFYKSSVIGAIFALYFPKLCLLRYVLLKLMMSTICSGIELLAI